VFPRITFAIAAKVAKISSRRNAGTLIVTPRHPNYARQTIKFILRIRYPGITQMRDMNLAYRRYGLPMMEFAPLFHQFSNKKKRMEQTLETVKTMGATPAMKCMVWN